MASPVSFTEKAVALYGAKQTGGSGVPETLSSSHALAAMTLSFDDNITSNEEAYLGNVQQREASVAITDRFADVKAETVLPKLGSLFGRPVYGYETAVLQFVDSISSGTIIFAGATMTVGSSATPIELAEELLAYLNGGSATQIHSTLTGTPNANFSYALNANDSSIILAIALTANTNVTSLTLAGTQAAKATLNVNDQATGALATIPIIPFMEAGKFHVVADASLSITEALNDLYVKAETQLQKAKTENSWAESNLLNAERVANKLNLLDLGVTGNTAVDDLLVNLAAARVETADILTRITTTVDAIKLLWHTMGVNLIVDPSGAALVADLLTTDAAVKVAVDLIDVATLGTTLASGTYIDALVNSNVAVEAEFITLKDKVRDFYLQAEAKQALLPALVTTGTYAAVTYATSANTIVQTPITTASLVPVIKELLFTNEYPSSDTLTLHVRKSSDKLVGLQKTIIVTDAVATVDLTIEIGQRPKVAFNYHGNIYDIVNIAELSYPITTQKADAAFVTKAENVRNASLQETGSGLILNNICFSKLSFTNADGFEHQRVMTGCEDTWDTSAKAGTLTLTILEPEANTAIETQFNTEDSLGKEFWFNFKQDGTSGNTVELEVTKLILKGYKQTTVNNRAAFDLDFTYSGFTKISLK
jgi:hypothetical protein